MTKEEYKLKIKELNEEYRRKEYVIACNYIETFAYKVGDIITDHIGDARVLSYRPCITFEGYPSVQYECDNLTKKGTIKKYEPKRYVYHDNIISKK